MTDRPSEEYPASSKCTQHRDYAVLKQIFETSDMAMFAKDHEGRYILANRRTQSLLGKTEAEIIGQTDRELFPPHVHQSIIEDDRKVMQSAATSIIEEHIMFHGQETFLLTSKSPLYDEKGAVCGVYGAARDVTQRKRAEIDLERSNAMLDSITRLQALFMRDMDADMIFQGLLRELIEFSGSEYGFIGKIQEDEEGSVLTGMHALSERSWSEASRQFYGHLLQGISTQSTDDNLFTAALRTNEPVIVNAPADDPRTPELPDGHPPLECFAGIPLHVGDELVGIAAVANRPGGYDPELLLSCLPFFKAMGTIILTCRNDHRRKSAEEQVRQSEAFLQSILDGVAESIMLIDEHYRIRLMNRMARQSIPEQQNADAPLMCHEVSHGNSDPCGGDDHPCPLSLVKTSGQSVTVVHEHGDRTVEIIASPLFAPDGSFHGIIETSRDITQRVVMENQLRQSLSEKEALMRQIHHRVKNNLMILQSLISLQTRQIDSTEGKGALIESQGRVKAISLIHELLCRADDLTRINLGDYLNKLLRQLLSQHRRQGLHITTELPELWMDIDTIIPCGLIVNELATNALKYAFPNERAGALFVGLSPRPEGGCRIIVRDDGVGLPAGLDDPFTAKTLGMQIVTSLVQQIGAELRINRTGGTEFLITVPPK